MKNLSVILLLIVFVFLSCVQSDTEIKKSVQKIQEPEFKIEVVSDDSTRTYYCNDYKILKVNDTAYQVYMFDSNYHELGCVIIQKKSTDVYITKSKSIKRLELK